MSNWRLIDAWQPPAQELGIAIEGPRSFTLKSGVTFDAEMRLSEYGNLYGTVAVSDEAAAEALQQLLEGSGYGVALLAIPPHGKVLTVREMVEVLRTWGWAGSEKGRPDWM